METKFYHDNYGNEAQIEECEIRPYNDCPVKNKGFVVSHYDSDGFMYSRSCYETFDEAYKAMTQSIPYVEGKAKCKYYMNKFTGELFKGKRAMLDDAYENYDIGDETNMFGWQEYYEEVS